MGKILNRFYLALSNPGLLSIAQKRNLDFQWVIEAGCHDGSDTLKFLEVPSVVKIYAFEPDEVAANKAESKFKSYGDRIELRRMALMDKPGFIDITSPTGEFGDGNSIVGNFRTNLLDLDHENKYLKCTTIDTELIDLKGFGLLWLDVEGAAAKVLIGASNILTSVNLIQVEVELHNSKHRKSDFSEVNQLLNKSNFSLIYAPLHPGFFGDAVYIKSELLNTVEKLRSRALNAAYTLIHRWIYPAFGKPKL